MTDSSPSVAIRLALAFVFLLGVVFFLAWFVRDGESALEGMTHEYHDEENNAAGRPSDLAHVPRDLNLKSIDLRVCDTDLNPLATAWLLAGGVRNPANRGGRLSVSIARSIVRVEVGAEGFESIQIDVSGDARARDLGDIILQRLESFTIAGRVIDEKGTPVPGALVQVMAPRAQSSANSVLRLASNLAETGKSRGILGEVEASATGAFTIPVQSQARGFQVAAQTESGRGCTWAARSQCGDVVVQLQPVLPLRGRVVDSQSRSLPGVSVAVIPNAPHGDLSLFESEAWNETCVTDDSGEFELSLPSGGLLISVPFGKHGRFFVASKSDEDRTVEVKVPDEVEFQAKVISADSGLPVAGADLDLLFQVGDGAATISIKSKADGALTGAVPSGGAVNQLSLSAKDHATVTLNDTELLPAAAIKSHLMQSDPAKTIFKMHSGAACIGRVGYDGVLDLAQLVLEIQGAGGSVRRRVRCDDRGEFSIANLAPGPYTLRSVTEGIFVDQASAVLHHEAARSEIHDIRVLQGRAVSGRVIDHVGAPCSNTRVLFYRQEISGRVLHFGVFTDRDGSFVMAAVPIDMTFDVEVGSGQKKREIAPTRIPAGVGAFQMEDLVLLPLAEARGVVSDPDGNPVPGARISRLGGGNAASSSISARRTNPQGKFSLSNLPTNTTLRFIVNADGYRPALLTIENLQPAEVRLGLTVEIKRGHRMTGTVVDHNGETISGATISASWSPPADENIDLALLRSSFCSANTRTNAEGKFVFDNLPADTGYRLRIGAGHLGGILRLAVAGTSEMNIQFPKPKSTLDLRR